MEASARAVVWRRQRSPELAVLVLDSGSDHITTGRPHLRAVLPNEDANATLPITVRQVAAALLASAMTATAIGCGSVARVPEQTYLGTSSNWAFRARYPRSDRLFNAFDYGHAVLYEQLLRAEGRPDEARRNIEGHEFDFITTHLLLHPPALPLEEHAVGPRYTTLVPELYAVFDWTHLLHRQLYDVLADERLDSETRDRHVARLLRYYASRRELALSRMPKSMALMEGAPYSLVFRRQPRSTSGARWPRRWASTTWGDRRPRLS